MIGKRSESLERALLPAGGTVTDAELDALGSWARPRGDATAWAAHVRELLAASPGRDLASAAIEARLAAVDAPRRGGTGPRRAAEREPVGSGVRRAGVAA